jgi:osmotically-inducible protein OsmY
MHPGRIWVLVAILAVSWSRAPGAPTPADSAIEERVRQALAASENRSQFAGLRIHSDEGILTLRGRVPSLYALDQAIRLAGAVRGVLDVFPSAALGQGRIPDSRILAGVQAALRSPSFSFVGIRATVGRGRVELAGSCGSYAQRALAEQEIAKVAGVIEIRNRIEVTSETNASERQIARMVSARIAAVREDSAGGKIRVSIQGSRAILTGRVPLYRDRLDAAQAALGVPGIKTLDNRLIVDPMLAPSAAPASAP